MLHSAVCTNGMKTDLRLRVLNAWCPYCISYCVKIRHNFVLRKTGFSISTQHTCCNYFPGAKSFRHAHIYAVVSLFLPAIFRVLACLDLKPHVSRLVSMRGWLEPRQKHMARTARQTSIKKFIPVSRACKWFACYYCLMCIAFGLFQETFESKKHYGLSSILQLNFLDFK